MVFLELYGVDIDVLFRAEHPEVTSSLALGLITSLCY